MATHMEMEVNSCSTEMELQETQRKQEENTTEIEPNMLIMKNWLDIDKYNENQKILCKAAEKTYNDYIAKGLGRNNRENPLSAEETEEQKKVMDAYRKYCIRTHNRYGESIQPPQKKMDTFHEEYRQGVQPSQFMFDFIEATHSLFQIQQKRIDELETVVAELSAKNQ